MTLTTRRLEPAYLGETWIEDFQAKDETGAPLDLTDADAKVEIFYPFSRCPALTATIDNGLTIADPTTGVIEWRFEANQTSSLCPGVYTIKITLTRNTVTMVALMVRLPVLSEKSA